MKKNFTLLILFLVLAIGVSFAQTATLSGKVLDNGEPVIGATVQIKGTTLGTITDVEGNYLIAQVPAKSLVLVIRSVGYKEQEQSISLNAGENKTLDISLEAASLDLDAIVVTGLSVNLREKEQGTSRANVSSQTIEQLPAVTVEDALVGRLAGVETYTTDGVPGGGFRFRIRGGNSIIGASEPLVIVDGVFLDNSNRNTTSGAQGNTGSATFGMNNGTRGLTAINPEDIESIEVLKGAAAASLYGSRASSGVIVVKTKSGGGGKPTFEYSMDMGSTEIHRGILKFKQDWSNEEIGQWATLINTGIPASLPQWLGSVPPVARQYSQAEIDQWRSNERTNWSEQIFQTGTFARHTFRFSGGDSKLSYYASAALQDNIGHQRGTNFYSKGARVSVTSRPNDKLEIRGSVDLSFDKRTQPAGGSPGLIIPIRWTWGSNAMPFMREQDIRKPISTQGNGRDTGIPSIDIASRIRKESDIIRAIGSISAKYNLNSNLSVEATVGIDDTWIDGRTIYPNGWTVNTTFFNLGRTDFDKERLSQLTFTTGLNHAWRINENFTLKSAIGTQYDENTRSYSYVRFQTQNPVLDEGQLGSYSAFNAGSNFELLTVVRTLGIYVNETLGFKDKLFLNLGGRLDRGTAFKEQFFFYPRASLSYQFKDNIRFRTAIGTSGTQPPPYQTITTLVNDPGGYDTGSSVLSYFSTMNADLKPEVQSELEIGADASFLKGRINLEVTYYSKNFSNLLLPAQRNPALNNGFTTVITNIGKMYNRGFEFSISADVIKSKNLNWNLSFTGFTLVNKVTSLDIGQAFDSEPEIIGGLQNIARIRKDYPLGGFWGITATSQDLNDFQYLGSPFPKFEFNINNQVDFKGVFLRMLWGGKTGMKKFNATARDLADPHTRMHEDYWNTSSQVLVGDKNTGGIINDFSQWVQNANFLKLRFLTVGYTIPKSVLGKSFGKFVKTLTISATGANLLTLTKYEGGFDVEAETSGSGSGNAWIRGIDSWDAGMPRSYTVSLNIGF
jgi:TonB-linked SusC/RagA family outer membrane protein